MGLDFNLKKLKKLYLAIIENNYKIITFFEYFRKNGDSRIVILRHDIDKIVKNALKIALLEHGLGIKSSFYFRFKRRIFNTKIIREIARLGHEIGYHYEVLSKTKGDLERGIELFKKELSDFRKIVDINTICMHGSPLSKWDSRKLWDKFDYKMFGIIGEPYFDINYNQVAYFTDTGRRWDGERVNINVRDTVISGMKHSFRTTDELITAFREDKLPDRVMINIHPQRWHGNFMLWTKEFVGQNLKNVMKKFLTRNTLS